MPDVRRTVLLSADPAIRSAILRLAALAGSVIEVVADSRGARTVWRSAAIMIVGVDLAGAVAAIGLPRRDGVFVVTSAPPLAGDWRSAVALGAGRLVELPVDDSLLIELLGHSQEAGAGVARVVAVVGACGGAGSSTLAATLALMSSTSVSTVLIDGDRLGGGLDVLLGAEQSAGARWSDLAGTQGWVSAPALTEGLVRVDELAVLSWGRSARRDLGPEVATSVLDAAMRAFARVVLDLPRRLDPASEVFVAGCDLVTLLVPATVRATAAAATVAAEIESRCPRVELVVRDGGGGQLGAEEIGSALGRPVLARYDSETPVRSAAQHGDRPPRRSRGSLTGACQSVLAAVTELEAVA